MTWVRESRDAVLDRTVLDPGAGSAAIPETTQLLSTLEAGAGFRDVTQQAIARTCPVCATPNTPLDVYCQDCGLLFTSVSGPVEALPDPASAVRLVESGSGRELLLNPGQNVAGREGDLLVDHPTVSRRHAAFTLEGGRVWLEDLGSSNGTSVGDRRLPAGERAEVMEGDVARLGSVALTVRIPGGTARPPTAAPEAEEAIPAAAAAPVAWLEGARGEQYLLHAGQNTVGRRAGNQIVIADAFMSGRHAD
ncbi:MAG: FHA domain-containing protein, partial [Armatimonadetes bacterium]|nr:FHA domain-containing protein [Armatimonadota bacterium]